MPRGIVCLTLKLLKPISIRYTDGSFYYTRNLSIGQLSIYINTTEEIPNNANFDKATKSLKKIHKRINAIRDALNHTNLDIFINDKLVQPYKVGTRYKDKGIYLGIERMTKDNNTINYYNFRDSITGYYRERFNDTKK